MKKLLYFDIDGVLLEYDSVKDGVLYMDIPKPALIDGHLENILKKCEFDELICVSGWSQMVQDTVYRRPEIYYKERLYEVVGKIFPDKEWFFSILRLTSDTDQRCQYINMNSNWYYIDDHADEFFVRAYGEKAFKKFLGERILQVDPFKDGNDLIDWLKTKVIVGSSLEKS